MIYLLAIYNCASSIEIMELCTNFAARFNKGALLMQVLCVAVHNHYKRIYSESSNWLDSGNFIWWFSYASRF